MKPTNEQLEAYKAMAAASPDSMKAKIEANLRATCDKFSGHEDRLEDCMEYLTECAREILNGKNGEVDDDTCYRICRDYFNDEIWKKEDEDKARKKAEDEKRRAKTKDMIEKEKKETCTVCRKEFKKLYVNGLCRKCHEEKRRKEAEAAEIKRAQQEIIAENNRKLGIGMAQPIDMFAEAV